MNSQKAKQIRIIDYLAKLGIEAKKIINNEYWYNSIFRKEKEASFKVDNYQNIWYDHGLGKGGNIIDLAMMIHNCNVSEALKHLSESTINFSFFQQQKKNEEKHEVTTKELNNPLLLDYLIKRGIETSVAKRYCKEAYYTINNRNYYSIAFINDSGGYELRNKYVKLNLNGKDITTINNNQNAVCLFEGFFDYLAFVQYNKNKIDINDNDYIILNSLSLLNSAIERIKQYEKVYLYLDNDTPGKEASNYLISIIPNCINKSSEYKSFKDYNDFLLMKEKN